MVESALKFTCSLEDSFVCAQLSNMVESTECFEIVEKYLVVSVEKGSKG